MARRRDTNWSRDEITVLLDSIEEITKTGAEDGKRISSKEVFEYAAKKMGERGHNSRADREKCRTKWKKMKEEYMQAIRAREGDTRCKEAPGILPFFSRMEEFVNGSFDNISPHSTIVRRRSSLAANKPSQAMRSSARLAASTAGPTSVDGTDTSSTIVTKINLDYGPNDGPQARQTSRLSSSGSINNSHSVLPTPTTASLTNGHDHQDQQPVPSDDLCMYTSYSDGAPNTHGSLLTGSQEPAHSQPHSNEHADISYRVSNGCRQITIFGDHDVDIKFRGDCVTINKINVDYPTVDST